MDQKVLSLYALRSARGDVMKNAFFQKLLSDPYIYIRDKSKACLMRALLWFIGIPYNITLGMIKFVMKVCLNASLILVVVQS